MLLNSKLPIDVLGRVWELADIDKDGMLDSDEFAVVSCLDFFVIVFSSSAVFAEFLKLHSNPNPDLSSCSILILFANGPF